MSSTKPTFDSLEKDICIYHSNCADGFAAAWSVHHIYPHKFEFFAATHGTPLTVPPRLLEDKNVLIVDFSYKRDVIKDLLKYAKTVTVLDHHITAIEDLAPLIGTPNFRSDFDIFRSGAMITWDYLAQGSLYQDRPPPLLKHIQDRDLWKFELPGTREIQAALFSYPYDFEVWDELMLRTDVEDLIADGKAIERKHTKDIDELLKVCTRQMSIGGFNVPVANLPYTLASDAGNKLAIGAPFAACYMDTPEARVFSLRSTAEGEDVSKIAARYGGGGHRNASGFRVPLSEIAQFEITS